MIFNALKLFVVVNAVLAVARGGGAWGFGVYRSKTPRPPTETSKRKGNFTSHRLLDVLNAVRSLITGEGVRKYYANQYQLAIPKLTQAWENGCERGWICQRTNTFYSSGHGVRFVSLNSGTSRLSTVRCDALAALTSV